MQVRKTHNFSIKMHQNSLDGWALSGPTGSPRFSSWI